MSPNDEISLSQEQIKALQQALEAIPQLKREIARAKSAGLAVTVWEQQLNELEKKANKIHTIYVTKLGTNL